MGAGFGLGTGVGGAGGGGVTGAAQVCGAMVLKRFETSKLAYVKYRFGEDIALSLAEPAPPMAMPMMVVFRVFTSLEILVKQDSWVSPLVHLTFLTPYLTESLVSYVSPVGSPSVTIQMTLLDPARALLFSML
jgi:hypothetical protein